MPAAPLDPLAASLLAGACPGFGATGTDATALACCDAAQVAWLVARLAEASSYVGACPACDAGLRALWCGLVCGPDQARAWNVTAPLDWPQGNGTAAPGVAAATVWLAPKAAAALHEACRGVIVTGSGVPALVDLTGGPLAAGAGGWLNAWGGRHNSSADPAPSTRPASPAGAALLTFVTNPPPAEAVNATAFTWEVAGCGGACGCADCPTAPTVPGANATTCPAPLPRPQPPPTGCVPLGLGHTRVTCGGLAAAGTVAGLAFFFPALASALATAGTPWPPAVHSGGGGGAEPLLGAWSGPPAPLGPAVEATLAAWLARRAAAAADTPRGVVAGAALFLAASSLGALFSPPARSAAGLATIGQRAATLMYAPSPGSRAAREAAVVEAAWGGGGSVRKLRLALAVDPPQAPTRGAAPPRPPRALTAPALAALFDIHAAIANNISVPAPGDALAPPPPAGPSNLSWADVCARGGPPPAPCLTASPLLWWGLNRSRFDEDVAAAPNATLAGPPPPHGGACADGAWAGAPGSGCGHAPLDPLTVLGWPDAAGDGGGDGPPPAVAQPPSARATVLFAEYALDGSSPAAAGRAAAWEAAVLAAATSPGGSRAASAATPLGRIASAAGCSLTLEAERSLGDELAREAFQHRRLHRLGLAGALMASFWAASLSRRRLGAPPVDLLVTARAGLGLVVVGVCGAAGAAGAGLAGWAGVEASAAPFVLASLPVLALATVGEGAAFLVAAFDAAPPAASVRARLGTALTAAGPPQAAATAATVLTLSFLAAVGPPAARGAAAAGALTVAAGFGFLVTAFAAALAADARRAAARRADLAPCVVVPAGDGSATTAAAGEAWAWGESEDEEEDGGGGDGEGTDAGTEGTGLARARRREAGVATPDAAWAGALPGLTAVATLDAPPRLSSPGARAGIAAAFVALLGVCAAALPGARLGHDPVDALPPSSYVRAHRGVATATRRVGPPLDVVITGLTPAGLPAVCGRAPGCAPTSLVSAIAAAAATPESAAGSFIGAPPAAWVDAFLAWADPAAPGCCSLAAATGDRCEGGGLVGGADCEPCFASSASANATAAWPALDPGAISEKLAWFLASPPSPPACAVGGDAFRGDLPGVGTLATSRLRTHHTPLRSPADMVLALARTRAVVDAAAARAGITSFAWARWHGVAEREGGAARAAVRGVVAAASAVALAALALLGCPRTAGVGAGATAATAILALAALRLAGSPLDTASAGAAAVAAAALAGPALHLCAAYGRASGASPTGEGFHDVGRARVAGALAAVGAPVLLGSLASKVAAVSALALAGSRTARTPLAAALVACACASAFVSCAVLPAVVLPLCGPAHRQAPGGPLPRRARRQGGWTGAAAAPPAALTDPASVWPADDAAWPADDTGTPPPE